MRICILSEYFYPDYGGGTGTVLTHLARYLRDHYPDVDIDVVTSKHLYRGGDGNLPEYEEWDGIRIHRVSTPPTKHESMAKRLFLGLRFTAAVLRQLLRGPRYDVLLIVSNPPMLPEAGRWLRWLRHTPYVYLTHDLYPDLPIAVKALRSESLAARLGRWVQRRWLATAAKVVTLGRCMQAHICSTYAIDPAQVAIITNWADLAPTPRSLDTEFRAAHGLTGTVVMYAGNMGQYIDCDEILNAAKMLAATHPTVTFALLGDGIKRAGLERRIADEGIANVHLFPLTTLDTLADTLASADISLITFDPGMEGIGVPSKLYNLLAVGRPIIALMGGQTEVALTLAEGRCGVCIDHSDGSLLANAIAELCAQPAMRQTMGDNACTLCAARFTLPVVAVAFADVLRHAAGEARP